MKSDATKQKFIQLRAEGLSYAKISEQLHLSKATCSSWENKFTEEIATLKKDHLQELYDEYGMEKEARIKALGKVLSKIDDAIDDADFSAMTPAQLLDARLKYQKALSNEYVPTTDSTGTTSMNELQARLLTLADQAKNNNLNAQSAKELQALTLVINETYHRTKMEHTDHSLGLDLLDRL